MQPAGNYFLLPIFLILFPLIYYFIFSIKYLKSSVGSRIPPGPTPWPIVGNIFQIGKLPHVTLAKFAQTYGPDLISLRLGTQYLVVGSSPAAAVEILKTHDRILSARSVPCSVPLEGSELQNSSIGMNEVCNDTWRYLRTLCKTELFSSKALDNQAGLREEKIPKMVDQLRCKEGKVVDIGELVFATLFNALGNMLCSRDLTAFEEDTSHLGMKGLVRRILELGSIPNLSDFYPIFSKLDLQGLRRENKKLFARLRSLWELIIEERRKSGANSHQDFLDTVIHNNLTNPQINQLFTELFTAGVETTTSTIEWAMADLMRNPESMKKVREELEREINRKDPMKEAHLVQMPYLQACVKESMRLHPIAPLLLPHRALETCQVMNYTIPKNAQIFVNVWAIGRDPSIWDEPLRFRPERFLNSGLDYKGTDFEFLPFGSGRRICPGLPMASRHVPLVLASLINFFDWSLPNGKNPQHLDMKEKFGMSLLKEQPLFLIPKARK